MPIPPGDRALIPQAHLPFARPLVSVPSVTFLQGEKVTFPIEPLTCLPSPIFPGLDCSSSLPQTG